MWEDETSHTGFSKNILPIKSSIGKLNNLYLAIHHAFTLRVIAVLIGLHHNCWVLIRS